MDRIQRWQAADERGWCCVCRGRIGDGDLVIRGYGGAPGEVLCLHAHRCARTFLDRLERARLPKRTPT